MSAISANVIADVASAAADYRDSVDDREIVIALLAAKVARLRIGGSDRRILLDLAGLATAALDRIERGRLHDLRRFQAIQRALAPPALGVDDAEFGMHEHRSPAAE